MTFAESNAHSTESPTSSVTFSYDQGTAPQPISLTPLFNTFPLDTQGIGQYWNTDDSPFGEMPEATDSLFGFMNFADLQQYPLS